MASSLKVAIVTGGTRGIGLGIAQALAGGGYSLVLGYNSNHAAAEEAKKTLEEEYKVTVKCVPGDVALPGTIEALFQAAKDAFGDVTTFVHNAGLYVGLATTATTEATPAEDADWDTLYDYYQQVYPRCFKRGVDAGLSCPGFKHVIAISSPGCNLLYNPVPGYHAPGQAKASMEFMARNYAKTLAPKGINVNVVVPGFIATGAWEKVKEKGGGAADERIERQVKATPMQRWGQPKEIGDAVAFLCSDKASFITGVVLPVDGGHHLGKDFVNASG